MLTDSTISKMGSVLVAIIGEAEQIIIHQLSYMGQITDASSNLLVSYSLPNNDMMWNVLRFYLG